MKNKVNKRNYGYTPPVLDPTNYVLGGTGCLGDEHHIILNPERDWLPFLPLGELQRRNIETYSCTEFGTIKIIATLIKNLFKLDVNYSERAVAIGSKNTPEGNNPQTVADYIRHNGLVDEKDLPFDDSITTFEQYMSPNPLTDNLVQEGLEWLKNYDLTHEYVFTGGTIQEKQAKLLEALQYSPVGVSVYAWEKQGDVYVKPDGSQDNHWTVIVAGEEGKPWMIADSYCDDGSYIKELDWNYSFGIAKSYFIKKKETNNSLSIWKIFINYLLEFFK